MTNISVRGMINAGAYDRKIDIYSTQVVKDADGFQHEQETLILTTWAKVKTTRGYTIIEANSDFEKAYTNFTIRYPNVTIDRDMTIHYAGKIYRIHYLNNVDERSVELEIQAREVTH